MPVAPLVVLALALVVPVPDGAAPQDDASLAAAVRHAIERDLPDAAEARATLGARRADLLLARDVLDALAGAELEGVVVSVADGVVEVRGEVRDAAHASRVIDAASAVPAVRSIRDRLRVAGAVDSTIDGNRPVGFPLPGPLPGPDLVAGAMAGAAAHTGPFRFLTRAGLAGRDLQLRVQDGIVDVTGAANSTSARHHVIVSAQTVPGVRAVRTRLDVRASDSAAERRLATLVRRRLQYDALVQGVMPAVTVRADRGVILLEGLVRDEAQRRRAVQLARAEQAVFAVDDRLDVDPRLVLPPAGR